MLKMTWCYIAELSLGYLHNHFPKRARFLREIFLNSNPPFTFGLHTISQPTRWSFLPSPIIKGSWQPRVPSLLAKGSQISATHAYLSTAKANKDGNDTHKGEFPHHLSLQNLTLYLLPTRKEILVPTMSQFILISFHNPTSYVFLTSREHHPPLSSPYFPLITWFHKAFLSFANCQFHLQRRASLSVERHLTPKPSFFLLKHTNFHLTKWGFRSKFPPPQGKFLWICSSLCLTELGMRNKDINPLQGCLWVPFVYVLYNLMYSILVYL